jgi:hypothetical protein
MADGELGHEHEDDLQDENEWAKGPKRKKSSP